MNNGILVERALEISKELKPLMDKVKALSEEKRKIMVDLLKYIDEPLNSLSIEEFFNKDVDDEIQK